MRFSKHIFIQSKNKKIK